MPLTILKKMCCKIHLEVSALTPYSWRNKNVVIVLLKYATELDDFIDSGNEFHRTGATTLKERSPCRLMYGAETWAVSVIFFGVRIRLGTIFGRFSIIYFRGLGLRIRVRVWVRVWVRVRIGVGVRVSVVLWSW